MLLLYPGASNYHNPPRAAGLLARCSQLVSHLVSKSQALAGWTNCLSLCKRQMQHDFRMHPPCRHTRKKNCRLKLYTHFKFFFCLLLSRLVQVHKHGNKGQLDLLGAVFWCALNHIKLFQVVRNSLWLQIMNQAKHTGYCFKIRLAVFLVLKLFLSRTLKEFVA